MRQDEFDAYMRRHIAPVQPGTAFDERTRRTLAQLLPYSFSAEKHMSAEG